ncbi:hypothetical protein BYT27DRAFT_7183591 [Phlegmacium glaucopus]|nr:hypothetical protein BYT27DRAFT_7183591 [Phlegmacium glaucopus]
MISLTLWTRSLTPTTEFPSLVVGRWLLVTGPCPTISSGKLATTTTTNLIHNSD